MDNQVVRIAISLNIAEGKLAQVERLVEEMVAATRNEPGALGYEWYLSPDRRQCRILETYADSAAVTAHLAGPVARESLPKLLPLASVGDVVIYGDPGPEAAAMFGRFGATIFSPWRSLKR